MKLERGYPNQNWEWCRIILKKTLIVVCACGAWSLNLGHADESEEQDTKSIEAAFVEFNTAFRHLDWQRLRKTFAEEATMFSPSSRNAKRLNGIDEIERVLQPMFEGNLLRRKANGSGPPEAKPVAALDLVIQQYDETAVVTFQPQAALWQERRSLVLRRVDDKWLIVHLHASNTELSRDQH